ncbi:MAG: hypothetical protein KatS3mg010_1110 [Acidimicrobiia bacterium]|nr:MAG: hypothetical protein KatS3mg010_1110 [Acidimicrobiia bacterium]
MAAVVSLSTFDGMHPRPHAGRPGRPAGVRRPSPVRARRSHRAAAVYRRRRLVAAALGLGVVLAAGHAGAALGGDSLAPVERRPQVVTVVVEPGDTLWSIARRVAPDRDPREVVDALVAARGTAAVVPGEAITWLAPAGE